jgi:hypothetical protein
MKELIESAQAPCGSVLFLTVESLGYLRAMVMVDTSNGESVIFSDEQNQQ